MTKKADAEKKRKTEKGVSGPPLAPGLDVSAHVKRIVDVFLVASSSDLDWKATRVNAVPQLLLDISKDMSQFSKEDQGILRLRPKFELRGVTSESEKPEKPDQSAVVRIGATFMIVYEIEDLDSFSATSLAAFSEMNGTFNAWPYWREFVQATVARMGLPTLVLPVLHPLKK